ncbi:uncharacterized protein RCC_08191 [Ramularia collo-cygni]|uniref:Uncharacterized protein n=1 Tax=Ramularia collo-cygni TaxID=112498 RepID=A0A2D3UWW3_9PEZI|nr:uncharacterized protein RCC_08191 [Ramularia collo-cygni]CZT22322.1 uncharacterized protein RCC_08191 [Ramularia collo-cygni]
MAAASEFENSFAYNEGSSQLEWACRQLSCYISDDFETIETKLRDTISETLGYYGEDSDTEDDELHGCFFAAHAGVFTDERSVLQVALRKIMIELQSAKRQAQWWKATHIADDKSHSDRRLTISDTAAPTISSAKVAKAPRNFSLEDLDDAKFPRKLERLMTKKGPEQIAKLVAKFEIERGEQKWRLQNAYRERLNKQKRILEAEYHQGLTAQTQSLEREFQKRLAGLKWKR